MTNTMEKYLMLLGLAIFALTFKGTNAQASITNIPANTSALLGGNATFFCEVTGTQSGGQTHNFRKTFPEPVLYIAGDDTAQNTTKFTVSDKYRLTINDIVLGDEGTFQCDMFATSGTQTFNMYLTVCDPPTTGSLLWPNDLSYTTAGVAANLTCKAGRSHPPATFRWFRGDTEVTNTAYSPIATTDSQGYGESESSLTLTPATADLGVVYKCMIDVPAQMPAIEKTLAVSFSGSRGLQAGLGLMMITLITMIFQ